MNEPAQTVTQPKPTVAKEILVALDKLDKRKCEILDLQDAVEVAREAAARFDKDLGLSKPSVDAFPRHNWGSIVMIGFMASTADLQPLLSFLANAGYRQSAEPKDIPEMQMRMWRCGPISLMFMLGRKPGEASDGKTCRYVEVGTKEVPIYELKCE